MAELAWQQDTNLHVKPHSVIPTHPFQSFSTAMPAPGGRGGCAYGSSGCTCLVDAPTHTACNIQENIFEVSMGWFCLVETSLRTQVWGTKDDQVIISEVTFPPVQSRKAEREVSWGCGPAPASSIFPQQRRNSVTGKTVLWFDFLSNHSSSGTGAKE